jgi:hypothetical protein
MARPMNPPITAKASTGTEIIKTSRRPRDFIENS